MKNDGLKKFIDAHREEFDDAMPNAHLWEKIEDQLPGTTGKKVFRLSFLKAAASVLLLITVGWMVWHVQETSGGAAMSTGVSANLQEVQNYYTHEIDRKLTSLKKLPPNKSYLPPVTWKMLQINTPIYSQLLHDLQNNPGDRRVQAALIEYYKSKLDLIEKIQNTYTNMQTSDQHEKTL